ncbi:MAG: protein rep [Hyphomicrobiaceae bacterium]
MTKPKPLRHVTSRLRIRQWQKGKQRTIATADAYRTIAVEAGDAAPALERLADRIGDCARRLDFVKDEQAEMKLANAWRCNCRCCALCMAATARAAYAVLAARIKSHAEHYPRSLPALLTLTVPNVKADQLSATITSMTGAFRKMRKMNAFERSVLGWRRSTEVTYNSEQDTWHPHFHVLLMLSEIYWLPGNFLHRDEWQAMWQKATRLPVAIVDIRRKGRDRDGVLVLGDDDSLAEAAKYVVKPAGIYEQTASGWTVKPEILKVLHYGLRSKRLYDFGGTLKAMPKPERPEPFSDKLERLAFIWSEIIDQFGEIHAPNYWPEDIYLKYGPQAPPPFDEAMRDADRPRAREPPSDAAPHTHDQP